MNTHLSEKVTFGLQYGWPLKRGSTGFFNCILFNVTLVRGNFAHQVEYFAANGTFISPIYYIAGLTKNKRDYYCKSIEYVEILNVILMVRLWER